MQASHKYYQPFVLGRKSSRILSEKIQKELELLRNNLGLEICPKIWPQKISIWLQFVEPLENLAQKDFSAYPICLLVRMLILDRFHWSTKYNDVTEYHLTDIHFFLLTTYRRNGRCTRFWWLWLWWRWGIRRLWRGFWGWKWFVKYWNGRRWRPK